MVLLTHMPHIICQGIFIILIIYLLILITQIKGNLKDTNYVSFNFNYTKKSLRFFFLVCVILFIYLLFNNYYWIY